MKFNLPFLMQDVDRHGNVRLYVRRVGVGKVRMQLLPGSPGFLEEYQTALASLDPAKRKRAEKPKEMTLGDLVREFESSHRFRKVTTREQRNRHLLVGHMLDTETKPGSGLFFRDCPLRLFTNDHVRFLRDCKTDSPSIASQRVMHLRMIFNWGMEERSRDVKSNPAIGVKGLVYEKRPFHTWTEQEVAIYEERHPVGTMARLALDLLLYTGGRRDDAHRLGPQSLVKVKNPITGEVETWITFTPGKTRKKTGKVLYLPLLEVLAESLAATPHGEHTFLLHKYGKKHASSDSFGNWFKDRAMEAGLPRCMPHGLRKVGAVRAAENGATEQQMMAIFGWDTPTLAAHYAKMASQKKLTAASMHTLVSKG